MVTFEYLKSKQDWALCYTEGATCLSHLKLIKKQTFLLAYLQMTVSSKKGETHAQFRFLKWFCRKKQMDVTQAVQQAVNMRQ